MDQRSWQWLWAVCVAVGSILVFVVAVNRNIVLAVVFGALTLGALLFVMRGFQKYVKEQGPRPLSQRRRAWGIGFNVFALIYCVVVGPIAAVTGRLALVVTALSTGVASGYQLVRLLRADDNATSADHEGKPEDNRGPLSPAVETALDVDRPLLQAQPVDNREQHAKLTT